MWCWWFAWYFCPPRCERVAWVVSSLDMSLHCIPPSTEIFPSQCWLSDISITTSSPTSSHLTNCPPHSLLFALHHFLNSITPRHSGFTCCLLALTEFGDKQTPAEQMTSLITISPSQEFVFNIWLTEWESVKLSSTTSYHARLHQGEGLMHEHLFIKIKLMFNVEQDSKLKYIKGSRPRLDWTADLILDRSRFSCEDKAVFVLFWDSCSFWHSHGPGHPNLREIFVRFYKLIGMSWRRGPTWLLADWAHWVCVFVRDEQSRQDVLDWRWSEDQRYQFTGITILAANPGNN